MLMISAVCIVAAMGTVQAPDTRVADAEKTVQKGIAAIQRGEGISPFLDVLFDPDNSSLDGSHRKQLEAPFSLLILQMTEKRGKSLGKFEKARVDAVGRSLLRFVYMERRERGPMLWYFIVHQGEGGKWKWIGFNIKDGWNEDLTTVKETDGNCQEALKIGQRAMKSVKSGGVHALFDVCHAETNSILPPGMRTTHEVNFTNLHVTALARVGKSLDEIEIGRVETVAQSLVKLTFLEKHEKGVIAWSFTFYRTETGWKWINIGVADNNDAILAGKI
jgi:hypothetical protein